MKDFYTKITKVQNRGIPTPDTHVRIGNVEIIFKGDNIIGIDTPFESYRTEEPITVTVERKIFSFHDTRGWRIIDHEVKRTSEEGIIIHLNRLLKEQAEEYINDRLRRKILDNDRTDTVGR